MEEHASLSAAESLLEHKFSDRALLRRALTHRSLCNESDVETHNERLEFLGDAVLSIAVSELLMKRFPSADEGELTRRRAAYVSEAPLAAAARRHALGELLFMGRGQAREGGRDHDAILADAMEALLGALYLDAGLAKVCAVLETFLGPIPEALAAHTREPKSELQELTQARVHARPTYDIERLEGPDHAPRFFARARLDGRVLGEGRGDSKKDATRAAAAAALESLSSLDETELLAQLKGR